MARALRCWLVALATLVALVVAAAPASGEASTAAKTDLAAADEPLTFGTQPSTADTPDERPNYTWSATPSAVLTDQIAIRNYSLEPLELGVYASDAFNTAEGGYDLYAADRKPEDIGTWIALGQATVTVPPRDFVIVPFTLTVPADATPGDHSGGIVASLRTFTTDADGNRITLDQRVGSRVYVRISGPLTPELEVENIKTDVKGGLFGLRGDVEMTYTVRNVGNVRLAGSQAASVTSVVGARQGEAVEPLTELLPRNSLTVHTTVEDVPLALLLKANVNVDPSLVVVGDVADDPPAFTRSAFIWIWTWILIGLVIVALVAVAWWWRRRQRRRRQEVEVAYSAMAAKLPARLPAADGEDGSRA